MAFIYLTHANEIEISILFIIFIGMLSFNLWNSQKQNKIYQKKLKRADATGEIINNIRINLSVQEIKEVSVKSMALELDVDRCFIAEYNDMNQKFSRVNTEYLTFGTKSIKGELIPIEASRLTRVAILNQNILINDVNKYIDKNSLKDTAIADFYKDYDVKSSYAFPIKYSGQMLGILVLHYTKKVYELGEEDISFIENVANSIAIAIHQSNIYEKTVKQAQKELILRKISEIIRKSFSINELKSSCVNEVGKVLNANRCIFRLFDKTAGEFLPVDEYSEYRYPSTLESTIGTEYAEITKDFVSKYYEMGEELLIYDFKAFIESEEHTQYKIFIEEKEIRALFGFPIKYNNELFGGLFLHYTKSISEDEIDLNFIRIIINQVSVAFNQIKLYNDLNEIVTKERSILNNMPFMAWLKDKDSRYLEVNDSFAALYGGKPEDIIGHSDMELFPAVYSEVFIKGDSEVIENKTQISIEELIPTVLGPRWHETFKSPVFDENGNVVSTVGLARDITDRKDSEQELFLRQQKIIRANERETLLRSIITTVRSTLDIDEIKYSIGHQLGEAFKPDRCFFLETPFVSFDNASQYFSSPEIKDMSDYRFPKEFTESIKNEFQKGNGMVIYPDMTDAFSKMDTNSVIYKVFNDFNIKSQYVFGIYIDNVLVGCVALIYEKEKVVLEPEDIKILQTVAEQSAIAINQAMIYANEKKTAEREQLLRKIIETVRSTLDIDVMETQLLTSIGQAINADRCIIFDYNPSPHSVLLITKEYLSSPDQKSMIGIDISTSFPNFAMANKSGKDNIIRDIDVFFQETGPEFEQEKKMLKEYNVKSDYGFVITYADKYLGALVCHFTGEKHDLSDEDIKFLKILSNQMGIALYQAQLYEKEKETAERERLLRDLISKIRSSLDIKTIKSNITESIGKIMNLDRCLIMEYDSLNNIYLNVDEYSEYRVAEDVKSFVGFDFESKLFSPVKEILLKKEEIFISNVAQRNQVFENLPHKNCQIFTDYGIKTGFQIPLFYGEEYLGTIIGHSMKEVLNYTEEEKNFIKTFANQTGIALYQAYLYNKEKQSLQREKVSRSIIDIIRSSLDKNKIKNLFVNTIGGYFKADRVLFSEFDSKNNMYSPVDEYSEYLSSPEEQSFINYDWSNPSAKEYIEPLIEKKELNIFDWDEYIAQNPQSQAFVDLFVNASVKSSYNLPVLYQDKIIGYFCVEFTQRTYRFSDNDFDFIRSLCNQAGIALYQASLFEKEKKSVERERLLRRIVESAQSSLDINLVKRSLVYEVGKAFKADRCYFVEVDVDRMKGIPIDFNSEYLASTDIKSVIGYDFPTQDVKAFVQAYLHTKEPLVFDYEKILRGNTEYKEGVGIVGYINKFNLKQGIGFPFYYLNKLVAVLAIEYANEKRFLSEEELDFLKILGNQVGIVMNQIQLYEQTRQTADKEKILREIVSKIKLSLNLKEAYNILLQKMGEIFNLERVVFLESSQFNKEELLVKYEYIKETHEFDENNNIIFPQICVERFLGLVNNLKNLVINDISDCYADESTLEFFKKYQIKSILAVPLVKYNRTTKIFGFIVLCSSIQRIWTEHEIELLNAISDSIVSVIWEITKMLEIDEIRNSFVLTLAHDLQVPMVGERKALEFLLKTSPDQPLSKYHEIIEETLNNNIDIADRLKKLVDIYNYELKRKKLAFFEEDIESIINDTITALKDSADKKNIVIEKEIQSYLPPVFVDRIEISKVMFILLNNAISYSPPGSHVVVKSALEENNIKVSVIDAGSGIPEEIKDRLFKRYEMAIAIERKIGAGLNLYLSKQILEAHKGTIGFKTQLGKGTEFYFTLPAMSTD